MGYSRQIEWPLGVQVDPSPAKRPGPAVLAGLRVTLVPLGDAKQSGALYQSTHGGEKEQIWRYLSEGPYPTRAEFDEAFQLKAQSEDPLFFAILDHASGVAAGWAAFLRIEPKQRCIEVGNVLFTSPLQRTAAATESMYLMARHVFDDLGYRRYEWKCNAFHEFSRRAALRLGFRFEGIFRQHMIVKGRNRDTAWFSMLDSEWPERKANFERWLAPENFNPGGSQKVSLSQLNRG